eukprot:264875-Pyramimonas_sp.AAC.1
MGPTPKRDDPTQGPRTSSSGSPCVDEAALPLLAVRGRRLRPAGEEFAIASWIVEGYTESKQVELEAAMKRAS